MQSKPTQIQVGHGRLQATGGADGVASECTRRGHRLHTGAEHVAQSHSEQLVVGIHKTLGSCKGKQENQLEFQTGIRLSCFL